MIILRYDKESLFSDSNSAAQEAGMIAGSLGLGAGVGALANWRLRKMDPRKLDRLIYKSKKVPKEELVEVGKKVGRELKNKGETLILEERNPKLTKIISKIQDKMKKTNKFAKTKGGKWAIIGGTTAALGGATYLGAKKEKKK